MAEGSDRKVTTPARKRRLALTLGALAIIAILYVVFGLQSPGERQLLDQLALAKREGIPTTFAEYRSSLPAIDDADNAAPIYAKLEPRLQNLSIDESLGIDILRSPTEANLAKRDRVLSDNRAALTLIDEVVRKKGYRSKNFVSPATAPNPAPALRGATLLLLRGDLYARTSPEIALGEVQKARILIDHLRAEPNQWGESAADLLYVKIARRLLAWAFTFPNQTRYRDELRKTVEGWPKIDFRARHRLDLIDFREKIALSKTAEGRRELGPVPKPTWLQQVFAATKPQAAAEAEVVAGVREVFSAFDLPVDQWEEPTREGHSRILKGLSHFPVALNLYTKYIDFDAQLDADIQKKNELQRVCYEAALRALESPKRPSSLDLSDLVSPFSGKPLRYSLRPGGFVIEGDSKRSGRTLKLSL